MLAFDTSSDYCIVALLANNRMLVREIHSPKQQANLILPLIKDILIEADISQKNLDAIAYGAGPGSFTGIRIANSVAQGLAYTHGLPIIQLSSLAILAQTAMHQQPGNVYLVARDARMGKVYLSSYRDHEDKLEQLISEQACSPHQLPLAKLHQVKQLIGVGDGWLVYEKEIRNQLSTELHIMADLYPKGQALLMLAQEYLNKQQLISYRQALPLYY